MTMTELYWQNAYKITSRNFLCGHCGNKVASNLGICSTDGNHSLFICPECSCPTYINIYDEQTPGVVYGEEVKDVPEDLMSLYNEARRCYSVNSYTTAVLACRKMLMHIGVEKGAKEGESFMYYVEYLVESGFVPPDGKGWVDHIRKTGNVANHQIILMKAPHAEDLISFVGMLLKFIYELPARLPTPSTPN